MSRRLACTLSLVVLLTLSVVAGGRTQEQPLVAAELHQKAWQQGTVRVLVQLQAPYVAEPSLPSPAHVMAQRRNIAATQSLVRDRLRGLSHRVIRDYGGSLPVLALHVGPDGLRMLESLRGVVTHVVEDRVRPPLLTESAPRIQANQTTALGYDGTGSVIVVMDTGVDKNHAFFRDGAGQSRVIAEACFSTDDPLNGITSLCPGRVDMSTAPGSGMNCPVAIGGCEHGTHVAGIAAGRGTGIAGVAPGAQLVAIQVFSRFNDPGACALIGSAAPCVGVYDSDLLAAGSYVLNTLLQPPMALNIAAINLSLGGDAFSIPCDGDPRIAPAEVQLINDLRAQGAATVAASGNEFLNGLVADPACVGAAISVGATTDPPSEAIADFSNRGPGMSLLAPGVTIRSSVPGAGFASLSGTSMAAPHVAGAFAVLRQARPTLTVTEGLDALQSTGLPIGGFQRVRLLDALASLDVPSIQFSSATYNEDEGDATHAVAITLTRTGDPDLIAATTSTVSFSTVSFSTGGGTATPGTTGTADYVPVINTVVTFAPGDTTKDVLVTIRGDFTIEPNETVGLALSAPRFAVLGAQRTATLTIVNDDLPGTIAFDLADFSVNEAAGPAMITLRRTGGLAAGTSVMVSTGGGTAVAGTDYSALVNKVVTFVGGADTATFTVAIVNNTLAQADKTVGLSITGAGAGAAVGVQNTATLTIVNDDVAGSAQFSAANYQVTEGTATATITVTRTGGTASGVTVQYRVKDGDPGTATGGGVDYTLATGTLSFGVNETTKTFTVAIVNDTIVEDDETVNVELVNPTGGLTLGAPSAATLTVHDNDAPTFKFGSATYSVAEGAAVNAMVVRANGLGSVVTVDYEVQGSSTAIGGLDYTLPNGTVTFGVGATSQLITIPTLQDTRFEGSEKIVLKLVNPSAGTIIVPDTTTVTITDNDTPGTMQFSAATYGVDENAGTVNVRVTRAGANLASDVTVQFTTTNGTATAPADYADATQVLTFAAGETFKDVPITIIDDAVAEGNRTVVLALSGPSPGAALGTIKTAVLTIRDDEQGLQFSAPVYVVNEATPSVTVTVVRTGPTIGTVTVDYASAAGSATPGADYTNASGTLTFGSGIASRTFTVPIINDTLFEVAESVALLLNNPTPGAQLGPLDTSTITIVDNDPPGAVRFSAATYTVAEAMAVATITVQRTSGATASAVTVDYATVAGGTATAGADYLLTSGTLAFKAGETSKTFTIPILNDKLAEPSETVNLALANPTGGATLGTPSTAMLTITDDDVAGVITFSAPTFTVVENAGPAVIKVNRTGAAGGVTVDFTTADGTATQPADYTATNQTLSFAAGEMSKTVGIPIVAGDGREGNETVRLILSNPTGGATLGTASQAVLTIIDSDTGPVVGFGATAFTVAENVAGRMASITIVRSGSTSAGQTVLFSTTDGTATADVDYTAVTSQSVTFTAGQTTATMRVPIINGTSNDGNRTVNLALTMGGASPIPIGTPATAVLTILEDDATIQFATAAYNVVEGGVATLIVTRTGGTVGSATVAYATSNGTAIAPGAYTAKSGTLTFGPGVTSQTITVTTLGNTVVDGSRTFTVTLSSPGPTGTVLDVSSAAAIVTITDNGAVGSLQFSSATYSVAEGAAAMLTVTRTGGSAGTVTVAYATSDGGGGGTAATGGLPTVAGTDYTPTSGVLTFTTGTTNRTITVPTKADTALEGPETFTVTLSAPSNDATLGAQSTAVVTIVDAQAPRLQFATANYSLAESAGSVTFTVQRVGPTTAQNTVDYTLAGVTAVGGGVDFVSTPGTLTFAPGIASRSIVVPIVDDTINEAAETFTVTLSNPTGGALLGTPGTATVTITDNDLAGAVQFSQVSYAVIEGETASITVTRTGTSGPVTVNFATSDGTATAPDDYTPAAGTLTFQAGETTKTFTVATTTDLLTEGAESVTLTLSGATNGLGLGTQSTATLWILDRQQSVQFSSANASVVEGKALTIAVTRAGVPDGTVTMDYQLDALSTTAAPADFTLTPGPGTLTFPPGVTTRTITVQAVNNTGPDGPRSIVLQLMAPSVNTSIGAPGTITIALIDNERPDLVVTALTAPAQVATGLPMTVVATVGNVGGGIAPATSLGIFVSDSSATPGDGVQIGTVAIPALAVGTSFTATGAVNVPAGLPPGTYFVSAVADAPHVVPELDDTNNGLTAPTQVEVVLFQAPTLGGTTFYVSPSGNDFNLGTAGQPFRTIAKARDTVRALNGNMTSDATVYLRGGEYVLTDTLELTQADSGSNGFNVIYQAYPGERPVLTGGQRITGWTAVGGGIYMAPVPAGTPPFRQLYANGVRAIRARTPNVGEYNQLLSWDTGGLTIEINASEISDWSQLNRVEMVILGRGANQANLRIASFDVAGTSAFVTPSEPERTRIFEQAYPPKEPRPYFLENALEFLDTPGEWYLDTNAGEVFYMPRPGENMATLSVVVPRDLETLLRIRGDLDAPAHHIQFLGLTFEHTTWRVPDGNGYVGDQASIVFTDPLPDDQITSYPGIRLPGAIHIEAAHHTRLERNVLRHLGASAVNYVVGTHDNQFVGNLITDVSGSGVSVDLNLEGNPADGRKISRNDAIRNNYIEKTGRDYFQTVGIMAGYTDGIVIEHNELHDMPYSGISVGWGWANVPNAAQNNLVRYNRVWNVLQTEADGGGLYTLSRQPGTVLAENYIFDILRYPWLGGFEDNGIFLDNGSNLITVRDNVLQNIDDGDIRVNDNGPDNTFLNNNGKSASVIANAGLEPAYRGIRP